MMQWHCPNPVCQEGGGVGWMDEGPVSHCWACGALGRRGNPPNLCSIHRVAYRVPRP